MKMIYAWVENHPKGLRNHLLLLLGVSVLFAFVAGLAKINSFVDHPQFTHWKHFDAIYAVFITKKPVLYRSFFIMDAFWAIILLAAPMHILIRMKLRALEGPITYATTIVVYMILALIAYGFDLTEGVMYFFGIGMGLTSIVRLKTVFYVLALIVFLYGVLKYWTEIKISGTNTSIKEKHQKSIKTFLTSSILSLILIAIVGGLLTALEQGATIVVHLFYQPINLALMMPLLFLIAVVVSHYPVYFEARQKVLRDSIDWEMHQFKFFRWFTWTTGIGNVYYTFKKYPFDSLARVFRHHLGSLLFVSFLYVLLVTAQITFDFPAPGAISMLVFVAAVAFYGVAKRVKNNDIYGENSRICKWYQLSFWISILMLVVLFLVTKMAGWNIWSLVLSMFTTLSFLATYITFRLARKQYYGLSNLWLVKRIALFSSVTIVVLIVANIYSPYAYEHLNPITILLMYLLNFYGLFAILIKHVQFYADQDKLNDRSVHYYLRFALPMLPILLLLWSFISAPIKNDLHYLQAVKETADNLTLEEFEEEIRDRDEEGLFPNYIMTTSYGGGLMADVWALLVYNELQQCSDGGFLNSTINMSANSGGSIGIGNYANLWANYGTLNDPSKYQVIDSVIQEIGNFNHLAIDLTYLLGKDLIREMIPGEFWKGQDRSHEAMSFYSVTTGDKDTVSLKRSSYRSHWNSIYKRSGYFPTLTVSTIATDGEFGNAFSLMGKKEHQEVFRGIYNILDIDGAKKNSSISYYGALSSSNRFPLFSPTASIEGEGHFLDGGYYDNSGLMNSLEYLQHLLRRKVIRDTTRIKYVMINNSKSKYIKHLLKDWVHKEKDILGTGELSAIINTVTTVDKVSTHLEEMVRTFDPDPVQIYLPLRFTYDDVVSTFGGKPVDPFGVQKLIDENDSLICEALSEARFYKDKWGIVESPLARLLSDPAVQYQRAMIKFHPNLRAQIEKICPGSK